MIIYDKVLKDAFNIQSGFISPKNFYPNRNVPYMCIPNQLQTYITEGKRPIGNWIMLKQILSSGCDAT